MDKEEIKKLGGLVGKGVELTVDEKIIHAKLLKIQGKNLILADLDSGKKLVFNAEKVKSVKAYSEDQ